MGDAGKLKKGRNDVNEQLTLKNITEFPQLQYRTYKTPSYDTTIVPHNLVSCLLSLFPHKTNLAHDDDGLNEETR